MPISERDRKTLIIGGSVLGFLILVFLIYKVFLSGGTDTATTTPSPVSAISPVPSLSPSASPTTTAGGVTTFGGRDPFCVPQSYVSRQVLLHLPLDATAYYCPGVFVPSSSPTTSPSGSGTPTSSPSVPSQPTASSAIVGGKSVVLMGSPLPGSRVQVEVNGKIYYVAVGTRFGGGSFKLQGISGPCASFLYGDQPFSLCHA